MVVWGGVNRMIIHFSKASIPPLSVFLFILLLQIILTLEWNGINSGPLNQQRRPLPSLLSDSYSMVDTKAQVMVLLAWSGWPVRRMSASLNKKNYLGFQQYFLHIVITRYLYQCGRSDGFVHFIDFDPDAPVRSVICIKFTLKLFY